MGGIMNIKLNNRVAEMSARLTLVQGAEGSASRPIFATLTEDHVVAMYTDTGSRIRSHKMLQEIGNVMKRMEPLTYIGASQ